MSSPQAQGPFGNVLDLEAPARLPHHLLTYHVRGSAAQMGFVLPGSYTCNPGQDHIKLSGNPMPYVGTTLVAPVRPVFAPTIPTQHLSGGAQRTSDGSSAASGSLTGDSTLVIQGVPNMSSTLCPPGDEHTTALLQSLMSHNAAAGHTALQNAQVLQATGNAGGAMTGRHVESAPANMMDDILAKVQGRDLTPMSGNANGVPDSRMAFAINGDEGGFSTQFRPAGSIPVSAGNSYAPFASRSATVNTAAGAGVNANMPDHLRSAPPLLAGAPQLPVNPTLMIKGLNVDLSYLQPASQMLPQSHHQRSQPPPQLQPSLPLLPLGRTGSGISTAVAEPVLAAAARASVPPVHLALMQQGPPLVQPPAAFPDAIMRDTPVSSAPGPLGAAEAAAAAPMGFAAAAAVGGLPDPSDGARQLLHNGRRVDDVAAVAGSGARTRRRVDVMGYSAVEQQESSSMRGGEEALRASALGPSRQDSGGLRLAKPTDVADGSSPRRAGATAAPDATRGAHTDGHAGSEDSGLRSPKGSPSRKNSGQGTTGVRDADETKVARPRDEPDEDEEETTDGEAYTQQQQQRHARKRSATQRRRVGSASTKKELCRERNRTAQRRFRERQKDLIRVLQDKVEHQEALIKDLETRLAVYEPPKQTDLKEEPKTDTGGGDTAEAQGSEAQQS